LGNSNFVNTRLILGFAIVVIVCSTCISVERNSSKIPETKPSRFIDQEKQKGAHVFRLEDTTDLQFLHDLNLNWVTLVPWGYQEDYDSPEVVHSSGDSLEITKKDERWISRIKQVRKEGFKVFLKPHIWITDASPGKWRSEIYPKSKEEWVSWEASYREFILRYARVAELARAEMFCIGVELLRVATEQPDFFRELIVEIRAIYSGELTYAANWYEEYERIAYWDQLDYIGVQAYFPLAKKRNPSVKEVSHGWNKFCGHMETLSQKTEKRILFTELGYKSTSDSAIEPWKWMEHVEGLEGLNSHETQANCYEAFFVTVWDKDWFAGVHLWQLNPEYVEEEMNDNSDFTPQNKPAELIITRGFN